MKQVIRALLVLAILGGGGYYGYSYWQTSVAATNKKAAAKARNTTAQVERRKIEFNIEASGDIAPAIEVDVKPEVSARVNRLLVAIGDKVKKGQPIVELDDRDLLTERSSAETEIAGADVALEKAERNFERAKLLYQRMLISQEAFENLRSDRDTAKNNHDKALRKLETVDDKLAKTKIYSPMDGTVLDVPVVEGQVVVAAASVNSGTLLMTIADLSDMYISTHINQVDVAKIRDGQKVSIQVDSLPGNVMEGTVSLIAPVATVVRNTKGFTVTVRIEHLDGRVKPGMTAELIFPITTVDNALTVPLSAVFTEDDDTTVVYTVGRGINPGNARRVQVEIGVSDFDFAEIKNGLSEGDIVLLTRPTQLPSAGG